MNSCSTGELINRNPVSTVECLAPKRVQHSEGRLVLAMWNCGIESMLDVLAFQIYGKSRRCLSVEIAPKGWIERTEKRHLPSFSMVSTNPPHLYPTEEKSLQGGNFLSLIWPYPCSSQLGSYSHFR